MGARGDGSKGTALERLTKEARETSKASHPGAGLDWGAVEAKLFARVEAEAKARARAPRESSRESRAWLVVAAGLAVAAGAVVVLARHAQEPERADVRATAPISTLIAGDARVSGHEGAVVLSGDTVETAPSAHAIFRRDGEAPGEERVRWELEASSRARVTAASSAALVVALQEGAVEAEVTPVAAGEAFAVDVGSTRIAVHGTHLRVARADDRITVDLSRGVVSIGEAPRAGSTYGELVTAPAHVEFTASSPRSSLRVDHAAASVRAPASLDLPVAAAPLPPALPAPALRPTPPPALAPTQPAAAAPRIDVPGAALAVEPNPEVAIERAVEACILARPHADDVMVTVTSTLTVTVGDDGLVHGPAQFAPPLAPEVQTCASSTIFRVHFKEPGLVSIPIHVQR